MARNQKDKSKQKLRRSKRARYDSPEDTESEHESMSMTSSSDDSDDPDYVPSDGNDEEETEGSEETNSSRTEDESCSEDDEDDDQVHTGMPSMMIIPIMAANNRGCGRRGPRENGNGKVAYSPVEKAYLSKLSPDERAVIEHEEQKCLNIGGGETVNQVPLRFRILMSKAKETQKQVMLQKLDQLQRMEPVNGEYHKLYNWLDTATRIPLGVYQPMKLQIADGTDKIRSFLHESRKELDKVVFGHKDAKDQMMRILAQWIANPGSKGNVIGIHGSMGVGKTTLVKEGISKVLGLPFAFVALGGASDGAFLEGHSFTYEGAVPGKIVDILCKTKCMNPLIFFDELDKVSDTRKGEEVINILTHITDASQNERYCDRYLSELDLDLSKALIVFSYNYEDRINPILKDRMITINVAGYNTQEKKTIALEYMLPGILSQFGFTPEMMVFAPEIIEYIIERVPREEGVRNLKRGMESIVSWINMARFTDEDVTFPFTVTRDVVDKYLGKDQRSAMPDYIRMSMYT